MTTRLSTRSTVCALIPHYGCEQWLGQAIESLLEQTRPPDAVVVVDDGSDDPPVDIVAAYEDVTLLGASDNGGPYRLVQAVIDATAYDAYLFQDADDWSAPDRVEVLLETAAATGGELVGSHEVRVLVDEGDVVTVRYPLDVNAALSERPTSFPLLHPTSLVAGDLVRRLGGFATGMRFSGDAELLRRAGHAARVVNADHFGYFRRKRRGSLTLGSDTALGSPARQAVQAELAERALANAARVREGRAPDLTPLRTAPAPTLRHLAGPPLGGAPRTQVSRRARRPAEGGPVFVVGAPRSGHTVLGWALGQHPSLDLVLDSRWLARVAADVEARTAEEAAPPPPGFHGAMASALGSLLAGGARPVASGAELLTAAPALRRLFPEARFVHVVRDVDDAAAALEAAPTVEGAFYTADQAWRTWLAATDRGLLVEEAFGSEVVLRVTYRDLVERPEAVVRRCLDFVGEPFDPVCTRPLTDLAVREVGGAAVDPGLAGRCREQSRLLHEPQPATAPDPDAARLLHERLAREARQAAGGGSSLVERMRSLVTASVPEGSTVAVVSRGDPRLVDLDGRRAWHLPQVEGGVYAGHHPADGSEALAQLDDLRRLGADHLAVPASSLWWLTWYDELRHELADGATLVAFHEEVGAVYRLTARRPEPDGKPGPPRFVAEAADAPARTR